MLENILGTTKLLWTRMRNEKLFESRAGRKSTLARRKYKHKRAPLARLMLFEYFSLCLTRWKRPHDEIREIVAGLPPRLIWGWGTSGRSNTNLHDDIIRSYSFRSYEKEDPSRWISLDSCRVTPALELGRRNKWAMWFENARSHHWEPQLWHLWKIIPKDNCHQTATGSHPHYSKRWQTSLLGDWNFPKTNVVRLQPEHARTILRDDKQAYHMPPNAMIALYRAICTGEARARETLNQWCHITEEYLKPKLAVLQSGNTTIPKQSKCQFATNH